MTQAKPRPDVTTVERVAIIRHLIADPEVMECPECGQRYERPISQCSTCAVKLKAVPRRR